jgi:hypothetical protein
MYLLGLAMFEGPEATSSCGTAQNAARHQNQPVRGNPSRGNILVYLITMSPRKPRSLRSQLWVLACELQGSSCLLDTVVLKRFSGSGNRAANRKTIAEAAIAQHCNNQRESSLNSILTIPSSSIRSASNYESDTKPASTCCSIFQSDKSPRHVDSTRRRLASNILPSRGSLQVTEIDAPHIVANGKSRRGEGSA